MKHHVALALAALFCGTTLFACISARDHRENLGSTAKRNNRRKCKTIYQKRYIRRGGCRGIRITQYHHKR